jgi:hypothetical protein
LNLGREYGTVDIIDSAERLLRFLLNPVKRGPQIHADIVQSAERHLRPQVVPDWKGLQHFVGIDTLAERLLGLSSELLDLNYSALIVLRPSKGV